MEALFSSLAGGEALRLRIVELIAEAAARRSADRVDIHVMAFAFTDAVIAGALAQAAAQCPSMRVRILADWSQRVRARGQQVGRLAALDLPNVSVRYTHDQPYVWDASVGHMRWSYHFSRGLLHHKVLIVLVNGRPLRLACGSFNWTATAARSYENLLIIAADRPEHCQLISRMEAEFEALWGDGRATLSPSEAHRHYQAILEEFRRSPAADPRTIVGLPQGQGEPLHALDPAYHPSAGATGAVSDRGPAGPDQSTVCAFSARSRQGARSLGGHAEVNQAQRLLLHKRSGLIRSVPLTITSLALEAIARAAPGDTLDLAIYGLSARVPEYGALLEAARRGIRLRVLLDRATGTDVSARLTQAQYTAGLPIEVRTTGRMMHQKYLLNARQALLLTGTANMSTDASGRHLEHRIRIAGVPRVAEQFRADFDLIWERARTSPPYTTSYDP